MTYPFWLSMRMQGISGVAGGFTKSDEEKWLSGVTKKTLDVRENKESLSSMGEQEVIMTPISLSDEDALNLLENISNESVSNLNLTEYLYSYYAIFYVFFASLGQKNRFEMQYLDSLVSLETSLEKYSALLYDQQKLEEELKLHIEACGSEIALCFQNVLFQLIPDDMPAAGSAVEMADRLVRVKARLHIVVREALLQKIHGYEYSMRHDFSGRRSVAQNMEKTLGKICHEIKGWGNFINKLQRLYPENDKSTEGFQAVYNWHEEVVAAFMKAKALDVDQKGLEPIGLVEEVEVMLPIRRATTL